MDIILLILGVVELAIPQQFPGQDVIAVALLVIGAILLAVRIVAVFLLANKARSAHKDFHDRLDSKFR